MENSLSSEEIRDFWHPIPGLQDGLNNKKSPARFVYLTLLHYFYYNHQFSDQYICVYSQLKTCTSSELAPMLQGIISQETDMEIESQYVDSHGKSELGFALSYLEGFDLLPRYKTIGNQKIYLPSEDFVVKNIKEITTRSIDWQLLKSNTMR